MSTSPVADPNLDVHTAEGIIRGWRGPVASHWTAIPFAAQPQTVAQRFSPPQPVEPFTTVLHAVPRAKNTRLTLSVTAPAGDVTPGAGLPVLVFVHGGRFQSGHGDGPWYRGDAFALKGCVVVSVNYRYRFDGFLPLRGEPLPHDFNPSTEPPYFRAVEDLLAALRWVQRNSGAFGGDPNNVTALGQSAGATMITYTLGSPRAQGLVHRMVLLSQGAPRVAWTHRQRTARLLLGGPLSFQHVSSLSHEKINAAFRRFAQRYPSDCAVGLYPHTPENLPPVPMLTGTLRDEFARMGVAERIDQFYRSGNPVQRALAQGVITRLSAVLQAPRIRSLQKQWWQYCQQVNPPRPLGRAIGDSAIRRFGVATMEAHARKAPTWVYEFHGGPGDVRARGTDAQHCADLPLVFNALDVAPVSVAQFCGPDAQKRLQPLADRFHQIVVDFMHGKSPDWPAFHPDTGRLTKLFDMSDCSESLVEDSHEPVRRFFGEKTQ